MAAAKTKPDEGICSGCFPHGWPELEDGVYSAASCMHGTWKR